MRMADNYIGYVKKSALHPVKVGGEIPIVPEGGTLSGAALDEDDEDWYKFDDEKVSIFPMDKIQTLRGEVSIKCTFLRNFLIGTGEDSSAYVLLYRSKGSRIVRTPIERNFASEWVNDTSFNMYSTSR